MVNCMLHVFHHNFKNCSFQLFLFIKCLTTSVVHSCILATFSKCDKSFCQCSSTHPNNRLLFPRGNLFKIEVTRPDILAVLVSVGYYNKYHRLGGLNNSYLFLTVPKVGQSKVKVPADLVPGESFLSCL